MPWASGIHYGVVFALRFLMGFFGVSYLLNYLSLIHYYSFILNFYLLNYLLELNYLSLINYYSFIELFTTEDSFIKVYIKFLL